MYPKVTQKDRERAHVFAFLRRTEEKPKEWHIDAEQERPDFVLKSPTGQRTGLEMTELVTSDFGMLRKAERLVCEAIRVVVKEYVESRASLVPLSWVTIDRSHRRNNSGSTS